MFDNFVLGHSGPLQYFLYKYIDLLPNIWRFFVAVVGVIVVHSLPSLALFRIRTRRYFNSSQNKGDAQDFGVFDSVSIPIGVHLSQKHTL